MIAHEIHIHVCVPLGGRTERINYVRFQQKKIQFDRNTMNELSRSINPSDLTLKARSVSAGPYTIDRAFKHKGLLTDHLWEKTCSRLTTIIG